MKYPPRRSTVVLPNEVARPVFGLDIDGTMGAYHAHFLHFAEGYLGREFTVWHEYQGGSLASFMGVSKDTYRQVKMAYRRGGLKRSMPCYPGSSELSRSLRERGAEVIICTTRPFLQLDNVEPDTLHWLKRNGIQYDGVISGEHKYRDLARQYGKDRVVAVLEDLPALAEQAVDVGLLPVLKDTNYNRHHTEFVQVKHLAEASSKFHILLTAWEGIHGQQ